MTARDLPDPAAWGLPGCDFEPTGQTGVLRGTGGAEGYVFRRARRDEAQLAWLAHANAPAVRAGFVLVTPSPSLDRTLSVSGWTAEPFHKSRPINPRDLPRLRGAVARLHALGREAPPRPDRPAARLLRQADLAHMPAEIADACRAAWRGLPRAPLTLVHGALNPQNVGVSAGGKFVLFGWDAARLDHPLFDEVPLRARADPMAIRAALAYEVAELWEPDPARGQELAAVLLAQQSP